MGAPVIAPPATIVLRHCTKCGRNDLGRTMGELSHMRPDNFDKCNGDVRVAFYDLNHVQEVRS
jgi:hypothetical protein